MLYLYLFPGLLNLKESSVGLHIVNITTIKDKMEQ